MDEQQIFESALNRVLDYTPSTHDSDVVLGDYSLHSSHALLRSVADLIVQKTDLIPSFNQYQKWFQVSEKAPREPHLEDPQFDPSFVRYDSRTEKQVAKAARYAVAKKKYETEAIRHQKKQERLRTLLSTYRADLGGYVQYVVDTVPQRYASVSSSFFFEKRSLQISEAARQRHTFISGGTGSGKSETVKHLVRHYVTKSTNSSMVVLDPHGKLVNDISRFSELVESDRLVLIDPNLSESHCVTINPFETRDKSESGLETQSAHLVAAFEQILGGFTQNMQSILTPIVTTLLHREDSDLSDLVRFLDEDRNRDLLQYGKQSLPYEEHRNFFSGQFHSPNYESTKDALRNRFQAFLNVPTIKRFTCGKSTLDLEAAIDQKKVLLFNLSVSGAAKSTTTVLGQFVTALIQGYSMRRERYKGNPKTPIHMFEDECQYFTSSTTEEILGESRKYGLHLTLATQRTEQVGEKILDAILGNVGVFLVGRNLGKTLKRMSSELDIDKDEIRNLKTGEFLLSGQNRIPIKIKMPYVGQKYKVDSVGWTLARKHQLDTYYRKRNEQKHVGFEKPRSHAGLKYPLPTLKIKTNNESEDGS